jgi:hypothetical protein
MAVSILNFTCNQMFPFDGHLLATSPQQTTKLQIMNLTLQSRSMTSFLCITVISLFNENTKTKMFGLFNYLDDNTNKTHF